MKGGLSSSVFLALSKQNDAEVGRRFATWKVLILELQFFTTTPNPYVSSGYPGIQDLDSGCPGIQDLSSDYPGIQELDSGCPADKDLSNGCPERKNLSFCIAEKLYLSVFLTNYVFDYSNHM